MCLSKKKILFQICSYLIVDKWQNVLGALNYENVCAEQLAY